MVTSDPDLLPVAFHPGGDESLQLADAIGHRAVERRHRRDMAAARSRRLRRLPREPLFVIPLMQAVAYFFGLF